MPWVGEAEGFRIRAMGSRALLIDCGNLEAALRVFRALDAAQKSGEIKVQELIPAAATVLIIGAGQEPELSKKLNRIICAADDLDAANAAGATVEVTVHYSGYDLEEVAALTGMSVDKMIETHTAAEYTAAFMGFAPGFAYLAGGDPQLTVPRRATPRHRLPAGSVGLAGPFSGVYPRESPGGWQIIGFTAEKMWDLGRPEPAAIQPGDRVRFLAQRESLVAGPAVASLSEPAEPLGKPTVLRVIEPGLQTLIEDAGRPRLAGMGVGESGVSVRGAYQQANRLVGNRPGAAVLEISYGNFVLEAVGPAVLALTGAVRTAFIASGSAVITVPYAIPFRLNPGDQLVLESPVRGLRTILAVRGGIDASLTLGSRSRDTLAGLGPAPLAAGDELIAGDYGSIPPVWEGEEDSEDRLPAAGDEVVLRVMLGPRDDWFSQESIMRFFSEIWQVNPRSDRVGVRLSGSALVRRPERADLELPSEGMALGAIQVPPDGQPVLLMADRPLTGGYPVIAVIHEDDIDLAAQLVPGCQIRMSAV